MGYLRSRTPDHIRQATAYYGRDVEARQDLGVHEYASGRVFDGVRPLSPDRAAKISAAYLRSLARDGDGGTAL